MNCLALLTGNLAKLLIARWEKQFQGIGALNVLLHHVVRLVEQNAGVPPGALFVAPVRVFGRHDRIDIGSDLRIAEQVDRVSGGFQQIFQALWVHGFWVARTRRI